MTGLRVFDWLKTCPKCIQFKPLTSILEYSLSIRGKYAERSLSANGNEPVTPALPPMRRIQILLRRAVMAANQSIKELMAAETKASKIISEARQGLRPMDAGCPCTLNADVRG